MDDYPDLAEVDQEHVAMWLAAANSLLKLTADEVQACVRQQPWLLLSDLAVIKSLVRALTRVLSVEEGQVARMALSYPDVLELEPMSLMEQLVYVSNTTGMSYDAVVQLTLGCPAIALAEPRDVIRAWADVRSCCCRGEVVAAAERGRDGGWGSRGESERGEGEGAEEEGDAVDTEVARVLAARPGLLIMSGEEIRRELAAAPPPQSPPPAAAAPTAVTRAAASAAARARAEPEVRTRMRAAAGGRPAEPTAEEGAAAGSERESPPPPPPVAAAPSPSPLLRPRAAAVRRRAPRGSSTGGGGGGGGGGGDASPQ
ncbi:hypothetical protein PLESTM_001100300 [Pleodorina starrii]|nr:hypothetical protein PLESTM_001100300 [Pleodorina starrii]